MPTLKPDTCFTPDCGATLPGLPGVHYCVACTGTDGGTLHPDGSDCDYCTYDKPCVTIVNTLPAPVKDMVPNNREDA